MSILPILRWPDPILSEVCAPAKGDLSDLASNMLETMYDAPGRGLAAPQIGQAIRMFVMDVEWKEGPKKPFVFLNPKILEMPEEQVLGPEACLSIPGIEAEVPRAPWIVLAWTELDGARAFKRFTGAAAICVQHEMDHLDGKVIFDRLPDADRAALEAAYDG